MFNLMHSIYKKQMKNCNNDKIIIMVKKLVNHLTNPLSTKLDLFCMIILLFN